MCCAVYDVYVLRVVCDMYVVCCDVVYVLCVVCDMYVVCCDVVCDVYLICV